MEMNVNGAGHDQTAVGYEFAACRRKGAWLCNGDDAVLFNAQVGHELAVFGLEGTAFDGEIKHGYFPW